MNNRINRSEVIANVATRTGFSVGEVKFVYDALVDEVVEKAVTGNTIVLNGFGTFYVQSHKGHPIRFESGSYADRIPDYLVFKFSASRSMNFKLRELDSQKGADAV